MRSEGDLMDKHVAALVELARCYGYQITFIFHGGPADSGPQWTCMVDRGTTSVGLQGITINHSALAALEALPSEITREFLDG